MAASLSTSTRIVVIEDEPHLLELIRVSLESAGYTVRGATRGLEGLQRVRDEMPDLVVLDVNLPDLDGFEVLQRLRETTTVPVIMLTVQATEQDRVRGLELGADDYMPKPFGHRELISRIKAVLRRTHAPAPLPRTRIRVDDRLEVDLDRHQVRVDGVEIRLRPTEFRLLACFLEHPGQVLPHETVLSKVWGSEYRDDTQLLRLYVTYLRKNIEADPVHPRYITNERGLGYRFVDYCTAAPAP